MQTGWIFLGADLSGSDVLRVDLSRLPLSATHLEGAYLFGINLKDADLTGAHFERADLSTADLEGANLRSAHFEGAFLQKADLQRANFFEAYLQHADLWGANLRGSDLSQANLRGAHLWRASLEGADLSHTYLEGANLSGAHLGKLASSDRLELTDLRGAFFDTGTILDSIQLVEIWYDTNGIGPRLADLHWNGANLATTNWDKVKELGDERYAQDLSGCMDAVRANRQLAVALREQGMNEVADRFFYRSQLLQRKVFRLQRRRKDYLFSLFSWVLAGYGYRPWWTFGWYLGVILVCGALYYFAGIIDPQHHLSLLEAFVISVISFHGRGLFGMQLNDLQYIIAAVQAFLGLGIEIAFIVTFTQRFFAK